jgi:hypothetical protein
MRVRLERIVRCAPDDQIAYAEVRYLNEADKKTIAMRLAAKKYSTKNGLENLLDSSVSWRQRNAK